MDEKRKNIRVKVNWGVTFIFQGSSDYIVDEFSGRFTVNGLAAALLRRGVFLPQGSGIRFINANILMDKKLYSKYPDLILAKEDQEAIAKMHGLNEYEIKRFNRGLIDRGDPQRSPKYQAQSSILTGGSKVGDISEIGLRIVSKTPLPMDTVVEIEIHGNDLPETLKVWAQVVRTADLNDEKFKYEFSLVFLNIPYEKWKMIHDYIERAKGQGGAKDVTWLD